MLTLDQFWIQARLLTASKDWPMIAVGRVGSRSCSFDSVASAGAVTYSRKMNSSDHATDLRAARTDGVVKYRMRMCGSEAVPAIMQKARVTNFHRSIRSEDATSELQSPMRTSYAVFCVHNQT